MAVWGNFESGYPKVDSLNSPKTKFRVTVNVKVGVYGTSYHSDNETGTITIDGEAKYVTYSLPKNTERTVSASKDFEIGYGQSKTVNCSFSLPTTPAGGTKTGNASVSFTADNPVHWLNINVLNPDGGEDYNSGYFDEYVSANGQTYSDQNNEKDTTQVRGSYIEIKNIRPIGDYYVLDHVNVDGSNKGNITYYKYTIGDSDGKIEICMRWADASVPTLSSSKINFGSPVTINFNRKSSSYTHTVNYAFGSKSGTIATKSSATSVSWTPSTALTSEIPNAQTGVGTIGVSTYYGDKLIGTRTVNFTLTTENNSTYQPSFDVAATIVNPFNSRCLNTYSGIKITISNASAKFNSSIKTYSIKCLNSSSSSNILSINKINTSVSSASIDVSYTAIVTDSRGYSTTKKGTFKLYRYAKPQITSINIKRCDSNGNAYDDGTYAIATMVYNFSNDVGGNSASVHKVTINNTDTTISSNVGTIVGENKLDITKSYTATFVVTDAVGNSVKAVTTLSSAFRTMDWKDGGHGMSCGKISELIDVFENNFDMKFYKAFFCTLPLPTGNDGREYWATLPNGIYWNSPNGAVSNMPSDYGFVVKIGVDFGKSNSDYNVLYFTQSSGAIYRRSGNYNSDSGWKKIAEYIT